MASLASVSAAAEAILETETRLDALVDNAGAIFPDRTDEPRRDRGDARHDGRRPVRPHPQACCRCSGATSGARVISVTSGGMYTQGLHLDDLQWTAEPFHGHAGYARAKRAQVVLMREWARRSRREEFTAMHPGWADTPGVSASLPGFARVMGPILRTPAQGADTIVWLAAAPASEVRSGRACTSIAGRGSSTASRATRGSRRTTAAASGTPSSCGRARPGDAGRAERRLGHPTTATPPEDRMTTLRERIETTLPLDETFAYVADFANPRSGTRRRHRRAPRRGPSGSAPATGSASGWAARVAPMEYRINDFERPPGRPGRRGLRRRRGRRHPVRARPATAPHRLHGRHPPGRVPSPRPPFLGGALRADRPGRRGGMQRALDERAAARRDRGGSQR